MFIGCTLFQAADDFQRNHQPPTPIQRITQMKDVSGLIPSTIDVLPSTTQINDDPSKRRMCTASGSQVRQSQRHICFWNSSGHDATQQFPGSSFSLTGQVKSIMTVLSETDHGKLLLFQHKSATNFYDCGHVWKYPEVSGTRS